MNAEIWKAAGITGQGQCHESRSFRAKAQATRVANWWVKSGYTNVEVIGYKLEPEVRYPVK